MSSNLIKLFMKVNLELDTTLLIKQECKKCSKTFYHCQKKELCGDLSCDPSLKNTVKPTLGGCTIKDVWDSYVDYFKVPAEFYSTTVLRRPPVLVPYNFTNMEYLCAGCSFFEPLIQGGTLRSTLLDNNLFISNIFVYRFYDQENVKVTNRHHTGFFMLGLHCFESELKKFPDTWSTFFANLVLKYYYTVLKIPKEGLYVHEDYWTDGVNGGPSVEIFVNGIELGNVVFTQEKNKEKRALRYLDVGLGLERIYSVVSTNTQQITLLEDHLRSVIVGFNDGILPSVRGVGFNIRKLIENLLIEEPSIYKLDPLIQRTLKELYIITSEKSFMSLKSKILEMLKSEKERCMKSKIL